MNLDNSIATETARAAVTVEITEITPADAQEFLYRNKKNRPVAPGTVNRYLADMKAGDWAFTGDPFRFDSNGDLIDGQHRLEAISKLDDGQSVRGLIVRGLAPEAQMFMDQGRRRQPGAQLQLLGVKDAFVTAAGVRLFLVMEQGHMFHDYAKAETISTPAIIDWIRHNEDTVGRVGEFMGLIVTGFARGSVALCAAYMFSRVAPMEAVEDFFRSLKQGANLSNDNPILTLRNRLANIKQSRVRVSQREQLAFIIEAWNAWRDGLPLERLTIPKGGYTAWNFPEVH